MKKLVFSLVISLLIISSCSNRKELQGYWYGKTSRDQICFPQLVQFSNGEFIDYFSFSNNTFRYCSIGSKFFFIGKTDYQKLSVNIKKEGDELFFYKSDSLFLHLFKRKASNYIFDYLNDDKLIINLPKGNASSHFIGNDFRFENPLYLGKINNELYINFQDSTFIFNEEFIKKYLNIRLKSRNYQRFSISLIADKNVSFSDINRLKYYLKIGWPLAIHYLLDTDGYTNVNCFSRTLPPLYEDEINKSEWLNFRKKLKLKYPPAPPRPDFEYVKSNSIVFQYSVDSIVLYNKRASFDDLKEIITDKMKSDPHTTIIAMYLRGDASYQDYITIMEKLKDVYYDLRDEFLFEKYEINFRDLDDGEKYHEAIDKYPFRVLGLDSIEYQTLIEFKKLK
jgi:hypothetical protein